MSLVFLRYLGKYCRAKISPDPALVVFKSLGIGSALLAPVIGITGNNPADLVADIATLNPGARRQAQFERLD